jgi:hypothetical protein
VGSIFKPLWPSGYQVPSSFVRIVEEIRQIGLLQSFGWAYYLELQQKAI